MTGFLGTSLSCPTYVECLSYACTREFQMRVVQQTKDRTATARSAIYASSGGFITRTAALLLDTTTTTPDCKAWQCR